MVVVIKRDMSRDALASKGFDPVSQLSEKGICITGVQAEWDR